MRFRIAYSAEYTYSEPVRDNLNVVRVKPATTAWQALEDFKLRVDPEARLHQHRDYFGSEVNEFGIVEPHDRLAIEARMHVETSVREQVPQGSWDRAATAEYRQAAGEFMLPTEARPANGELDRLLEAARAETPLGTALALSEAIPERFEYRAGSTFVGSTVADLLEVRAGVCQDFVHLGLMLLRELGIGARYVSGFLFAAPEDGGRDSVEVQTHAWLEVLVPEEGERVWVGIDPTNRGRTRETHVKIGHGRHYQDVPPIRGVYQGPATTELETGVEMRRLNGEGAAA